MKIQIITIFIFSFLILCESKTCSKNDWDRGERSCEIIDGFQLVIKSANDYEKCQEIKEIKLGLKIIAQDVTIFNMLPNVQKINNPLGPAIIFSGSLNFAEIHFPSLISISGSPIVRITHPEFADKVYSSEKLMNDLFVIEARTDPQQKCSNSFLKFDRSPPVKKEEKMDFTPIILYIIIALCVIVALIDGALAFKFYSVYRKYKTSQTYKKSSKPPNKSV